MMEFVVRQISGLGNQLFQYAAGRFYARKYGASLRIAAEIGRKAESYGHPRPFLLKKFAITTPADEVSRKDQLLISERRLLSPVLSLAREALGVQIIRENFVERYTFQPDLPLDKEARIVYLLGYWQVHSIPDAIATELRAELTVAKPAEGANLETLNRIKRARTPVSLHIRRGDYTHPAEGDVALPLHYYFESIRAVQEQFAEPTFFVFSDDMAYARQNLTGNPNLIFVDHNDGLSPHEDLRLMSMCHHHIIANSTLSWWGAWLNARPQKLVWAPKHWRVGGCTESRDLLPPEWLLIEDSGGRAAATSAERAHSS